MVSANSVSITYNMQKEKVTKAGLMILVLAGLVFVTLSRNSVWQNDVTLFEQTVRQHPRKARPYNNLGRALILHGKYPEAIQMLDRALSYDPGYVDAMNNLAIAYLDSEECGKALVIIMRLLQISPGNADAHNTAGEAYMKLGELDRAISHFGISIALGPSNPERYYNAAMALGRLGKVEESCAYWRAYLERAYVDADVADVLKQMNRLKCP
jgi:tetratricopeptide (TPR) repeat protein